MLKLDGRIFSNQTGYASLHDISNDGKVRLVNSVTSRNLKKFVE
jgi:hypothetical protein